MTDGDRLFESLWTRDGGAVRDAARCAARLVAFLGHDTTGALDAAEDPRPPAAVDPVRTTAMFSRVLTYVDRVR